MGITQDDQGNFECQERQRKNQGFLLVVNKVDFNFLACFACY